MRARGAMTEVAANSVGITTSGCGSGANVSGGGPAAPDTPETPGNSIGTVLSIEENSTGIDGSGAPLADGDAGEDSAERSAADARTVCSSSVGPASADSTSAAGCIGGTEGARAESPGACTVRVCAKTGGSVRSGAGTTCGGTARLLGDAGAAVDGEGCAAPFRRPGIAMASVRFNEEGPGAGGLPGAGI